MKVKTIILSITALLLFSFTGCRKYQDPAPYTPAVLTSNMSIKDFKALHKGSPLNIPTFSDIIIAGKVISTDKYGNFYRSFFIQDTTLNGGGIEIKAGLTGMYNDYKIGQVVYVKPAGLTLGNYGNMIDLGYRSLNPKYQTAYIDIPAIIQATIFRGVQSTPVAPVSITAVADITDARYGTWVTLQNAEYLGGRNGLTTWAMPPNPALDETANYGEQNFRLAGSNTTVVVRSSGYSKFAGTTVPFTIGQRVNITGVLTRYNNTIQLVLNTDADAVAAP